MPDRVPQAFLKALTDLNEWLADAHVSGMVIGGVAASILGRPRATRDIDALVILSEDQWAEALLSALTISVGCKCQFGPTVGTRVFGRALHAGFVGRVREIVGGS